MPDLNCGPTSFPAPFPSPQLSQLHNPQELFGLDRLEAIVDRAFAKAALIPQGVQHVAE